MLLALQYAIAALSIEPRQVRSFAAASVLEARFGQVTKADTERGFGRFGFRNQTSSLFLLAQSGVNSRSWKGKVIETGQRSQYL